MNDPTFDVIFSKQALRDMTSIMRYIRREVSDSAAEKVRSEVLKSTDVLIQNPEYYPPEPLLTKHGNYHVIRLKKVSYKIFYEFTGFDVYIVRVIHSRRDLKRILSRFKP